MIGCVLIDEVIVCFCSRPQYIFAHPSSHFVDLRRRGIRNCLSDTGENLENVILMMSEVLDLLCH